MKLKLKLKLLPLYIEVFVVRHPQLTFLNTEKRYASIAPTQVSVTFLKEDANVGIGEVGWHKFCLPDLVEDC